MKDLFSKCLCLAFWLHTILLPLPVPAAKPTPTPKIPPQPVPCSLSSPRGDAVDIPLKIYGIRPVELEFRIRSQPNSGTLSEIRALSDGTATITYTPHPQSEASEDHFSYAVKTRDGVSAAAEVQLKFVSKSALIVGPSFLQFPETAVGESSTVLLEIQNRGEVAGTVELQVPKPWTVDGAVQCTLEPGAKHAFALVFSPQTPGMEEVIVSLLCPTPRNITLAGKGLPVLEFSPTSLLLLPDSQSLGRSGSFTIRNHSHKPQKIHLRTDARLHFEPIDSIAPNTQITRSILLPKTDVAPLHCDIAIDGHPTILSLNAPAVPARIEFLARSLDFGSLFVGAHRSLFIQVRNSGGQTAEVKLDTSPPFSLSDASSLKIPPLTTLEIPVVCNAQAEGEISAPLHVQTPTQTFSIPLTAVGLRAPTQKTAPRVSSPKTAPVVLPDKKDTSDASPPPFRPLDGPLELRENIVVLRWKGDRNRPLQHRAELRQLVLVDEDQLKETWLPIPEFLPEVSGEYLQAAISGMKPGKMVWIRIIPVDEKGAAMGIPWMATFRMPEKEGFGGWSLLGWSAVCAGMGLWFWRFRKRKRARGL